MIPGIAAAISGIFPPEEPYYILKDPIQGQAVKIRVQ
jgi:hypothetical protein